MQENSSTEQVYTSPFLKDPQFKQGLDSILAPLRLRNASEEEIEEVTRRAETFFAESRISTSSNATSPIEPILISSIQSLDSITSPAPSTTSTAILPSSTSPASDAPPYPLSFGTLASLIASGAPIPGIREIPNKLASEEPSISTIEVGKVKKPWER